MTVCSKTGVLEYTDCRPESIRAESHIIKTMGQTRFTGPENTGLSEKPKNLTMSCTKTQTTWDDSLGLVVKHLNSHDCGLWQCQPGGWSTWRMIHLILILQYLDFFWNFWARIAFNKNKIVCDYSMTAHFIFINNIFSCFPGKIRFLSVFWNLWNEIY